MSSPGRLTELHCPVCQQISWVIDHDYRGMDGVMLPYDERRYACARCGYDGSGWTLGQQSPAWFLLQPHDLFPMTQSDFDYWVGILKTHFPAHPKLSGLGTTFLPRLPEQADAMKEAHARAHPVLEMKDQDGARRHEPDLQTAGEWLEIMKPGDVLVFRRPMAARCTSGSTCLGIPGVAMTQLAQSCPRRCAWTSAPYAKRSSNIFLGTGRDVPRTFAIRTPEYSRDCGTKSSTQHDGS